MLNADTARWDGKNLVLIQAADASGCSHYRLRWNALYCAGIDSLGFIPIVLPFAMFDAMYLMHTKAIIFQRPIFNEKKELIERYKALQPKFGYKLICELDDQVFMIDGQTVPKYNSAYETFKSQDLTDNCRQLFPLFDEIVVSTPYLKRKIEEIFDVHNVTVIKNVVPRFLWSYPRKQHITEDIKKPTVVYSGSPTHYANPIPKCPACPEGVEPDKGDLAGAWCDWVIKNVREEKINFIVMGTLPWFWESIRDRITIIPWVDCNSFPRQVMETKADFSIAPLVENTFNKCKSSLRFTEACAAGMVFLGTTFEDSPYNEVHKDEQVPLGSTIEEIDAKFWPLTKKDKYNELLDWQYKYINSSGCWLESDKHINAWLDMIDNQSVGKSFI